MDAYQVLELIGEGSFGRVFRGCRNRDGAKVALKLIPKVGRSEEELSGLRSECKIQLALRHPNVVRMLDAFETPKEIVAVTEYLAGGDLNVLTKQKKGPHHSAEPMPEEALRRVASDLLGALHYLHSNRVLHRDLKPANVLLDESGRAKLCDFGFARNLGRNTMVLTSIKGTPLYMAPELIEERPYDHTADLWSAGAILYELATGHPPFPTTSLFQLIKKIRYEQVAWPDHLSLHLTSLLQGLLEKDPKARIPWARLKEHPFFGGNSSSSSGPTWDSICAPPDEVSEAAGGGLFRDKAPPLTRPLTESEELAKEMQRQEKAKLLPGGSQTLIQMAKRHEEHKRVRLALMQQLVAPGSIPTTTGQAVAAAGGQWPRTTTGFHALSTAGGDRHGSLSGRGGPPAFPSGRRNSAAVVPSELAGNNRDMKPEGRRPSNLAEQYYLDGRMSAKDRQPLTTAAAVVVGTQKVEKVAVLEADRRAPIAEGGEEEEELESSGFFEPEEWAKFLDIQAWELVQAMGAAATKGASAAGQGQEDVIPLKSMANLNYLSMICSPLRNVGAYAGRRHPPRIIRKTAELLALPLTLDPSSGQIKQLTRTYADSKLIRWLTLAFCRLSASSVKANESEIPLDEEAELQGALIECLETVLNLILCLVLPSRCDEATAFLQDLLEALAKYGGLQHLQFWLSASSPPLSLKIVLLDILNCVALREDQGLRARQEALLAGIVDEHLPYKLAVSCSADGADEAEVNLVFSKLNCLVGLWGQKSKSAWDRLSGDDRFKSLVKGQLSSPNSHLVKSAQFCLKCLNITA